MKLSKKQCFRLLVRNSILAVAFAFFGNYMQGNIFGTINWVLACIFATLAIMDVIVYTWGEKMVEEIENEG
jgi:hypothetical protein